MTLTDSTALLPAAGRPGPYNSEQELTGSICEVALLCPAAQALHSHGAGRELAVRKAKEQVQNLLSRSSGCQLLPKDRSLARKGKTRNWA